MFKISNFNDFQHYPHFQIFGSEDSVDCDVIVFVEKISKDVNLSSKKCKDYDTLLSNVLKHKKVNSNLGEFKNGYIVDVFKGTPDEVNNALYYTYHLHDQVFPNKIIGPVNRDVTLKLLRVTRCILSFFSRTEMRPEIKLSLRSTINDRMKTISKIDYTSMLDFPGKSESKSDIYKILAFQYGQIFSLIDGFEMDSYTKSGISKNYPKLKNMIYRNKVSNLDLEYLNECNLRLVSIVMDRIKEIGNIKEF